MNDANLSDGLRFSLVPVPNPRLSNELYMHTLATVDAWSLTGEIVDQVDWNSQEATATPFMVVRLHHFVHASKL